MTMPRAISFPEARIRAQRRLRHRFSLRWPVCLAAFALGGGLAAAQDELPLAGTATEGGLVPGTTIVRVTNLEDSGEGSLRAALEGEAPRIVVFEVSGTITLQSDLRLDVPYLTLAGQTAPPPGITITNGKLRISAHDIVVQHLAIRPGPADDPAMNEGRDAISVGPCADCDTPARDIRLENVSLTWGVDENLGLWGETLRKVTIRNSLIAEGLRNAGHPKGTHSMGLLIGQAVEDVEVVGNLFASNLYRNPVVSSRASAVVANNLIYNPGLAAMHIYGGPSVRAAFIGNVVWAGPDTHSRVMALGLPEPFPMESPDAVIFAQDNPCCGREGSLPRLGLPGQWLAPSPPARAGGWEVMPSSQVPDYVLSFAGSRPGERDAVDARIVDGVISGDGRIVDMPPEAPVATEGQRREVRIPKQPFAASELAGKSNLEVFLCLEHRRVGGPATPECSETRAQLSEAAASAR
ncbi:hypothetical protein [Afifella pfennigii]|uniref:hypothetical protein n=1 Tax=Afifella pfennigii TaxID=209897 RepID=UPI0012EB278B|nr:hypothetical protein [Afifella pfennigii]